ncbi:MAG: sialidase family protein, partial [Bacteroidota bacterium]
AVCNNADIKNRDQLTLRISFDNGLTWIKSFVIGKAAKDYKGDFTAYSDLVQLNKSHVGVLYEYDDYKQILFKSVRIK